MKKNIEPRDPTCPHPIENLEKHRDSRHRLLCDMTTSISGPHPAFSACLLDLSWCLQLRLPCAHVLVNNVGGPSFFPNIVTSCLQPAGSVYN